MEKQTGGEGKDGMQEVTRFVPLREFMLWEGVKTIFTTTMHQFGTSYSLLCKRNICRNRSIRNFREILWQYLWELNMPYPLNSTSINLLYGYMWTCIQRTMYAQWYSLFLLEKCWKFIFLLKGPVKSITVCSYIRISFSHKIFLKIERSVYAN